MTTRKQTLIDSCVHFGQFSCSCCSRLANQWVQKLLSCKLYSLPTRDHVTYNNLIQSSKNQSPYTPNTIGLHTYNLSNTGSQTMYAWMAFQPKSIKWSFVDYFSLYIYISTHNISNISSTNMHFSTIVLPLGFRKPNDLYNLNAWMALHRELIYWSFAFKDDY